jgi:hypothetical protein
MILSEAERERKISDFLSRKLRELDLEEDEPPIRSALPINVGNVSV